MKMYFYSLDVELWLFCGDLSLPAFKHAEGLVNVCLVTPTLNHSHPNLDLEHGTEITSNHMLLFL